jgi:hypothetical protein
MKVKICLAALIVLVFHCPAAYSQTPQKSNRLGDWEYKRISGVSDEVLNHHADEGWEVVAAVESTLVLKRSRTHRLFGTPTTDLPKPAPPPPSTCKMTLAQAPAIRGLRLGMTSDEVFAIFPTSEQGEFNRAQQLKGADLSPNYGYTRLQFNPSNYATKDRFTGIYDLAFELFDRKVVSISARYSAPQTDRPAQITEIIAKQLALPEIKTWPGYSEYSYSLTLPCEGFRVQIGANSGSASIFLTDPSYEKIKEERRQAELAKKLSEFKP